MYSHLLLFYCRYGAHLSREQVAELVAPHPHSLELVTAWLDSHGVPSSSISMTHGGGWMTITDLPVTQANKLLGASYQLYRHARTNDTTILRTISYGLPAVLHKHVQTVVPTTSFASARTLRQTPRMRSIGARDSAPEVESGTLETTESETTEIPESKIAENLGSKIVETPGSAGVGYKSKVKKRSRELIPLSRRDQVVFPASLRWLYNYVPTPDQNTLGVAGYLNEHPSRADLRTFMNYREDRMAATFTVVNIDGGRYDPSHPDTEANLDIKSAQATAYTTPHSIGGLMRWSPGSDKPGVGDLFLQWLNYILSQPTIPPTISMSYGLLETNLPLEYTTTVCNLFAQLGARGVSVLFSSGDNGIGAGDCKDGSGNIQFVPEFPATCTFGFFYHSFQTQVAHHMAMASQVPMSLASVARPINYPKRQRAFPGVASRLTFHALATRMLLSPPSSKPSATSILASSSALAYIAQPILYLLCILYSAAGRGVPDVSAQALGYLFNFNGRAVPANGTSCAVLVRLSFSPCRPFSCTRLTDNV